MRIAVINKIYSKLKLLFVKSANKYPSNEIKKNEVRLVFEISV